jgi:hypothetical protein
VIAKDSILSALTELRVQTIATIAESLFRSSVTPDQTLSFRIKPMNSKRSIEGRRSNFRYQPCP